MVAVSNNDLGYRVLYLSAGTSLLTGDVVGVKKFWIQKIITIKYAVCKLIKMLSYMCILYIEKLLTYLVVLCDTIFWSLLAVLSFGNYRESPKSILELVCVWLWGKLLLILFIYQ